MVYDVIIIGSGPAGISASLYVKRANLKVLIISKGIGTLSKVDKIENYYGLQEKLSGEELDKVGINQAKKLGVEIIKDEVIKIDYNTNFIVETINNSFICEKLIIATGSSRKSINIKGIKEFEGRGVSYCATCDGFFYRNKNIAVLGSKQYAIHEAEELKNITDSVTIFTNGEEIEEKRNLDIDIEKRQIKEVRGIDKIEEIEFEDNSIKKIDGIFVALGTASSSDLAKKLGVLLDDKNNIIVDKHMQTNIHGLFACGDCTGGLLQIAKAVYEGAEAGIAVQKQIREERKK